MNNKEKIIKFLKDFKEKYPNHTILKFTNLTSPMETIDENGIVYYKKSALRVLKFKYGEQAVVDKFTYHKNKIKIIYPDLELIKFTGIKDKCLIKDKNGFLYNPSYFDLYKGCQPSIETCLNKKELFIFKANLKHNSFYKYKIDEYFTGKQQIDVICPKHGNFKQVGESHLSGKGCKKCVNRGFSKESWVKRVKSEKACFYILKFYNHSEKFIKIGITNKGIGIRYKGLKEYKYTILKEIEDIPDKIYDLEYNFKKRNKKFRYHPDHKFAGYTECYNLKVLNNE